jgi:hypothetical protein
MSKDLENNKKQDKDEKKKNGPTLIDYLIEFLSSKTFVYGTLSGIGVFFLKYTIFDNFKPITEAERMINDKKFETIHFGDKFMVGI